MEKQTPSTPVNKVDLSDSSLEKIYGALTTGKGEKIYWTTFIMIWLLLLTFVGIGVNAYFLWTLSAASDSFETFTNSASALFNELLAILKRLYP